MERMPFLGFTLAPEVKRGLLILTRCETRQLRPVLELVAATLHTGAPPRPEQMAGAAERGGGMPLAEVEALFTGAMGVVRTAVFAKTSVEHFKLDLAEYKIPNQHIADLAAVYNKSRAVVHEGAIANRVRYPALVDLKWRVDVTISTSSMSRSLAPYVLMEMTTSDGRIKTFEVPHDKFHELRYNVARVLKEMQDLEQLQILKISDKS
ncbi:glutamate receptor 3 [Pelomyxa schiedti]|nr:glutamate receptor 3 [Pelomyxa schiedti]